MSAYLEAARSMYGGVTPQKEAIPGRDMVPNNAGGFGFKLDKWARLERFLVLGSEGGTYYVDEKPLTIQNVKATMECIEEDGLRVINKVVEISDAGRALKNTPALFVLALCASHGRKLQMPADTTSAARQAFDTALAVRSAAYKALDKVARTGTHLFQFNKMLDEMKHGWGRGRRDAVSAWMNNRPASELVYQALKYRERDGMSFKYLMRGAHPTAATPDHNEVFNWIRKGWESVGEMPHDNPALVRIWAYERCKQAKSVNEVVKLIREYNLTQEMVPTNWHGEKAVWEALIERMPMTAMLRNLGRLTSNGVITPMSETTRKVKEQLTDPAWLKKARVHPMSILIALKTYAAGKGVKGTLTWSPVSKVTDALDTAFYASFGAVTPTNKRIVLALDVSSSMGARTSNPILNCYEAEAAMALVTYATEPNCEVVAFSTEMVNLPISSKMRLDEVLRIVQRTPMGGGTDCAMPMMWARGYDGQSSSRYSYTRTSSSGYTKSRRPLLPVDGFVIFTDNETWYGNIHPSQALEKYRKESGIPAKLVVAALAANGSAIADPEDGGMLDISGMDAAVPQLISDFIGG